MKLLLLAGLIVFVVMWLQRPKDRPLPGGPARQPRLATEPMLPCAQCGVHAPSSEMLHDATGRAYCCEEHRSLHAAR